MKPCRLKMLLEDGRKVYDAKSGKVLTADEDFLIRQWDTLTQSAFSPDLLVWGPVSMFELKNLEYVRIVDSVIEPDFLPLDEEAIIRGSR